MAQNGILTPFGSMLLVADAEYGAKRNANWCKIVIIWPFDVNTAEIRVIEMMCEGICAVEDW